MLLTKEVTTTLSAKNVKYYEKLGYKIPMRKASTLNMKNNNVDYVYDIPIKDFVVKTEDLPLQSNVKVDVLCDCCKNNICRTSYACYINAIKKTGSYYCKHCNHIKAQQTMLERYGCESPIQNETIRKKIYETNIKKYGYKIPTKNKKVKEKIRETNIEKYGFSSSFSNKDVQEKYRKNCLEKYGYEYALQIPEVREKISQTFYKNGTQKISIQQNYLCKLFDGVLNYPIKKYCADIYIKKYNIVIEYDGGGHKLNVKSGRQTEEEYKKSEIIRNNIITREGYKQIRIISSKDYLPSDEILLQMLEQAKEYFNTTNHTWVEYIIDTSLIRNAEYKDGVFFDYGKLRKIRKEEFENVEAVS